jgi:hypothetical protein
MQDFIAILIAVVAVTFLAYRGWLTVMKRKGGCGACSNCPTSSETQPAALVQLSSNVSHAEAQSPQRVS